MDPAYLISITKQALYLTLILTAPPVLTAMLLGLTVGIMQATTQVQEQTLTFVPKLIGIMVTLAVVGPWIFVQLMNFATSLLDTFYIYVK
ncbi:MAG TPA: type III secretion system export apparatus subunit SctS [bacterium]|nr:type III secretion system export apparatus subunit SctS [bacterium]